MFIIITSTRLYSFFDIIYCNYILVTWVSWVCSVLTHCLAALLSHSDLVIYACR